MTTYHSAESPTGLLRHADVLAVVTAGANGIGAATSRRLLHEGARVVIADVDVDAGQALVSELGTAATFVRCDVAAPADWAGLRSAAHAHGGPVGVLVSNAAFQRALPAHEMSEEIWQHHLDVGLTGTWRAVTTFRDDLLTTGGAVVVTSSVHAVVGLTGHSAYAAVKGGITALVRELAVELGPRVRVNTVLPGPILTAVWDDLDDHQRAASVAETVLQRFGQPDEVAAAISFLTSPDASYVTGASLFVDGGWSITKASS